MIVSRALLLMAWSGKTAIASPSPSLYCWSWQPLPPIILCSYPILFNSWNIWGILGQFSHHWYKLGWESLCHPRGSCVFPTPLPALAYQTTIFPYWREEIENGHFIGQFALRGWVEGKGKQGKKPVAHFRNRVLLTSVFWISHSPMNIYVFWHSLWGGGYGSWEDQDCSKYKEKNWQTSTGNQAIAIKSKFLGCRMDLIRWVGRKPSSRCYHNAHTTFWKPHPQLTISYTSRNRQNAAGSSELCYSANHLTTYKW